MKITILNYKERNEFLMSKGLFELTGFENMNEDDLLNVNINESSEFEHPEENKKFPEQDVTVPGGLKETPAAKPADGEEGPKPDGGLKETPAAKPADAKSVSVPSTATLTSDEYNDALVQLQKSFKEGYEALGMLLNTTVVEESVEDLQEEYTMNAIIESYTYGPMYEKVTRKDKAELTEVVKKLRGKILDAFAQDKRFATATYDKTAGYIGSLICAILGITTFTVGAALFGPSLVGTIFAAAGVINVAASIKSALKVFFSALGAHGWQIIGAVSYESKDTRVLDDFIDKINEEFKEELGGYKLYRTSKIALSYKNVNNSTLRRLKRSFFGESGYILILDKEEPTELNNAIEEFNKAKPELEKAVEKSKKDAKPVKESTDAKECSEGSEECEDGVCKDCGSKECKGDCKDKDKK